jgi:putative membrane protein
MLAGAAGAAGAMSAANIMSVVGVANANEIGSSKIAQNKATNAEVKSFANDMVKEHQAMQQDADKLATQLNVTPQPADRAQEMKRMGDEMGQQLESTAKGAAFDRAYMQGQVQAHQATLDELTALQSAASEEQVRTLITNAIPKVRQHLERAQRIQGQLGS